jgi:hypothetical protein
LRDGGSVNNNNDSNPKKKTRDRWSENYNKGYKVEERGQQNHNKNKETKKKRERESKVIRGELVYDHKVQVLGFFYYFWKFKVKMTMKIDQMTSKYCGTGQK